jgi:putative ABC transport system ATP-binding protein
LAESNHGAPPYERSLVAGGWSSSSASAIALQAQIRGQVPEQPAGADHAVLVLRRRRLFRAAGRLDIGQLVAVIAAYRDLPPPIKELIDWDQQRLDVEAKFEQVVEHFSLNGEALPPDAGRGEGDAAGLPDHGVIAAQRLTVVNPSGDHVLDRVSLSLPLQRHIALSGDADEGAGILAQLLGGTLTASEGSLTIGGISLSTLTPEMRGHAIAYAGPEPVILDGSFRDNILYGLRRVEPDAANAAGWSIDHRRAHAADDAELAIRLVEVLRVVGLAEVVFGFGLARKLDLDTPAEVVRRISDLRARIRARLAERGPDIAIEPYDPDRYMRNATIGENVLFGVPVGPALVGANLASHAPTRQLLADLGLTETLTGIGRRIAATMLEIFRDLTPGHVMFERFSFIAAEEFQEYRDIVSRMEAGTGTEADRTRLIGLSLLYVEPRHRLGLLDEAIEGRILAARSAFRERAASNPTNVVAFYDPQSYCPAAPCATISCSGLSRMVPQTKSSATRWQSFAWTGISIAGVSISPPAMPAGCCFLP